MIFTTKYGKIFLFSIFIFLLFSCSSERPDDFIQSDREKSVIDIFMKSFKEKELQFTLKAEKGFSLDSSDGYILFCPVYRRERGDSIVICSDSCMSSKEEIIFMGNVIVEFEDSMVLYTNSLVYFIDTDSSITEDSILIEKSSNKMKSKGFVGSSGFGKIKFLSKVVLYDE